MKHAFAEKGATEADAVKAADQVFILVNFDGMTIATFVEPAIQRADGAVDTGAVPSRWRLGTAVDHSVEVPVNDHREGGGTDRACQPAGEMKPIQRDDPATLRLDPIERRIISALCHGKYAAGVSLQQHLGRDVDECGLATCHGFV